MCYGSDLFPVIFAIWPMASAARAYAQLKTQKLLLIKVKVEEEKKKEKNMILPDICQNSKILQEF